MPAIKWFERHFEELICCCCLALIAISVFLQVLARYAFNIALHWTEEVAAIAMVWAVYMGASLCVRERFHIRIIFVVQALPPRLSLATTVISDLFWALFSIFMLWVSWDYLAVLWKFTTHSPSLGINQVYPQSILIIGYGLMLVRLFQTYVNWYRDGGRGLPGALAQDDEHTDQEAHL